MLSAGDVSRLKTMSGWKPFAGSGEQLLLKVTSGPRKTAAGVMALAHYVARAQGQGEHARLELFDEMGEVVAVEDLKATIKGWDLLRNQENMRPGARDLVGEDNGVSLLPERERFWRNQAYHFVWSQTAEGTGLSETELASRMREATREFVFTEFAEREHQVLWGLHLDQPGRPHIHLIVKARSNGRKKGQLRLTPQILEDMRARLAKQARILDLPVHSERREDRPDLLRDILEGRAALRENVPRVAYDKLNKFLTGCPRRARGGCDVKIGWQPSRSNRKISPSKNAAHSLKASVPCHSQSKIQVASRLNFTHCWRALPGSIATRNGLWPVISKWSMGMDNLPSIRPWPSGISPGSHWPLASWSKGRRRCFSQPHKPRAPVRHFQRLTGQSPQRISTSSPVN